jgi:hypothetical protein
MLCKIWSFSEVTVKNAAYREVTLCGSCKNRCFGAKYRFHHQVGKNRLAWTKLAVTSNWSTAVKTSNLTRQALLRSEHCCSAGDVTTWMCWSVQKTLGRCGWRHTRSSLQLRKLRSVFGFMGNGHPSLSYVRASPQQSDLLQGITFKCSLLLAHHSELWPQLNEALCHNPECSGFDSQ